MNKIQIPTIIALLFLIAGVAAGVLSVQTEQVDEISASGNPAPKNVRVSNISDSSASISWTTEGETNGFVVWDDDETLGQKTLDQNYTKGYTHSLEINNLNPSRKYYFEIISAGKRSDNNGIPWQFKTGPTLPTPKSSKFASGKILTTTGRPAENALVYLSVGGSSLLSTTTGEDGSWLMPISNARDASLAFYKTINENSLIEISVFAGTAYGNASAQVYPDSANSIPPIILGGFHDFKSLGSGGEDSVPSADVNLPTEPYESKFKFEGET